MGGTADESGVKVSQVHEGIPDEHKSSTSREPSNYNLSHPRGAPQDLVKPPRKKYFINHSFSMIYRNVHFADHFPSLRYSDLTIP
jgi:hypothetical protein